MVWRSASGVDDADGALVPALMLLDRGGWRWPPCTGDAGRLPALVPLPWCRWRIV
jgi:hypothetical protein